jgi:hypothetical protein
VVGAFWKRGGVPVGRLGGSTSFGGGLSLAWVAIDFSWESRPVVDVSGSVRVGSGAEKRERDS